MSSDKLLAAVRLIAVGYVNYTNRFHFKVTEQTLHSTKRETAFVLYPFQILNGHGVGQGIYKEQQEEETEGRKLERRE
jgi:hypothetical protein